MEFHGAAPGVPVRRGRRGMLAAFTLQNELTVAIRNLRRGLSRINASDHLHLRVSDDLHAFTRLSWHPVPAGNAASRA